MQVKTSLPEVPVVGCVNCKSTGIPNFNMQSLHTALLQGGGAEVCLCGVLSVVTFAGGKCIES